MKTTKEVIRELTRTAIFENDFTIGVVFSNFAELRSFSEQFYETLAEFPDWIIPCEKMQRTQKCFKSSNGVIKFETEIDYLRGYRFDKVYFSNLLSPKTRDYLNEVMIARLRDISCFIEFKDSLDIYDSNCILDGVDESNLILNRNTKV